MFLPVLQLLSCSFHPWGKGGAIQSSALVDLSFHRCLFTIDLAVIRSCQALLVSISGCCFLGVPMKGPLSWLDKWLTDGKVCGLLALCSCCCLFASPEFAAYSLFTLFSFISPEVFCMIEDLHSRSRAFKNEHNNLCTISVQSSLISTFPQNVPLCCAFYQTANCNRLSD